MTMAKPRNGSKIAGKCSKSPQFGGSEVRFPSLVEVESRLTFALAVLVRRVVIIRIAHVELVVILVVVVMVLLLLVMVVQLLRRRRVAHGVLRAQVHRVTPDGPELH